MRYSTYIRYVREGDKVYPERVSKSPHLSHPHVRRLEMQDLFRGHTAWITQDIEVRQANQPRKTA